MMRRMYRGANVTFKKGQKEKEELYPFYMKNIYFRLWFGLVNTNNTYLSKIKNEYCVWGRANGFKLVVFAVPNSTLKSLEPTF